jgi:hypothetical protein
MNERARMETRISCILPRILEQMSMRGANKRNVHEFMVCILLQHSFAALCARITHRHSAEEKQSAHELS